MTTWRGWQRKAPGWYVRRGMAIVYLTAWRRRLLTYRTEPLGQQRHPAWWLWKRDRIAHRKRYYGPFPTLRAAMERAEDKAT